MTSIADLQEASRVFFARHWQSDEGLGHPPEWQEWSPFLFGTVPNNGLGGCYALFESDALVYVGLGASRGNVTYPGYGITRRLMGHVISADKNRGKAWSALKPDWLNVTAIYTIGLPSEVVYLAPALESYLIRKLKPPQNRNV